MKTLKPDATYHIIDLSRFLYEDPTLLQSLLHEVTTAIEEGSIKPLQYQTFPLDRAADAFRYMAQAKHIGKIVLTQNDADHDFLYKSDATYLITGGLRGLGLLVAGHLVDLGARHVVLMGRHKATDDVQENIAEIEKAGATVMIAQGDVSNLVDIQRVLDQIESGQHAAIERDYALCRDTGRWGASATGMGKIFPGNGS